MLASTTTALALGEAAPLAQAWLARVARQYGINAIFIKGAGLALHGLRAPRTSSDVDVLVEQSNMGAIREILLRHGWSPRPTQFLDHHRPAHSESFVHPYWPCDLDVHWRFPGFLAPNDVVFNSLWTRRVSANVANAQCSIPDWDSSVLLLALHSLRSSKAHTRHNAEFVGLVQVVSSSRVRRLIELARQTGAVETLQPFWHAIGYAATSSAGAYYVEIREWRALVESGGYGAYTWLRALNQAHGLPMKLRIIRRAVWPTRDDLRVMAPDTAGRTRVGFRIWRIWRGARRLPRAVRAMGNSRPVPR